MMMKEAVELLRTKGMVADSKKMVAVVQGMLTQEVVVVELPMMTMEAVAVVERKMMRKVVVVEERMKKAVASPVCKNPQ